MATGSGLAESNEATGTRGDHGTEVVEVVIGSWSCVDGLLAAARRTTRPPVVVVFLDGNLDVDQIRINQRRTVMIT